jgi:hypothetical protein
MASSVATLSLQGLPSVATPIGETKLEELDCGACPRYECRPAGGCPGRIRADSVHEHVEGGTRGSLGTSAQLA